MKEIKERLKNGINAYIKNDAKAAALASILLNKDFSSKNLIETSGFDQAILSLLPLINNKKLIDSNKLLSAISEIIKINTQGRILFLLCGPSSVGKDTLASYAKQSLYTNRIFCSYVRKYTTRERRGYEGEIISNLHSEPSGNYEYYNSKEEMILKKNDISLEYNIYDNFYALSGDHLISNNNGDNNLICIYGRLERIHEVRKEVFFKFKRIPFSILINSPFKDLQDRTMMRHSIMPNDQARRIVEIGKQINFIKNNNDLISSGFDLIIDNGNDTNVSQNVSLLSSFISKSINFVQDKF